MALESKTIALTSPAGVVGTPAIAAVKVRVVGISSRSRTFLTWTQLVVGLLLLEGAVWAARLSVRNRWAVGVCAIAILLCALDRPSAERLGLKLPTRRACEVILSLGLGLAIFMIVATLLIGGQVPANPTFPNWDMAWKYLLWALMQQFLLQSFFFSRCEELFGNTRAVWIAGTLFALAHLPNMILTSATLFSGLLFCDLFRRYRSIYPLGIIHAALGLALSSTVPENLLQHMRVGIGYLR